MNDSPIQRAIRRSNRNLLLACAAGILIVVVIGLLSARYYYNFISGPFTAAQGELTRVTSAGQPQKYWVNVVGDALINTGVQYTTTSDGKKTIEATYFALEMADRYLVVKLKGDLQDDSLPPKVTGWMADLTNDEKVEIIQYLEKEYPDLKGAFLPYKLETTEDFRTNGYIGIVLGLIMLGVCGWGAAVVLRRMANPGSHPVLKALARFGPLDFVTNRIETELAAEHARVGRLHLAASWLVYEDQANLLATRYEDAAWIYKFIMTQRYYGIPVSKTYSAIVWDKFGVKLNLVAGRKESDADAMLSAIQARAPWVAAGYSKDLEAAWQQDRAGFLAAVEQRKQAA